MSRIGPTSQGWAAKPRTGSRQSSSTTPASIACAIGVGMAVISAPSRGHSPVTRMSPPTTRNAPDGGRPAAADHAGAREQRRARG